MPGIEALFLFLVAEILKHSMRGHPGGQRFLAGSQVPYITVQFNWGHWPWSGELGALTLMQWLPPDAKKRGLPRGRGRGRAAAHLGGAAGTPVGLACGAAWAQACGASSPSPWPPASPSCRSRPCGEPSGSQALSPDQIGPGRAWGGAVPSDLVPTDMVHEAVTHVQTPARLAAQPRTGIPCGLHSDPGYRTAATATTAANSGRRLQYDFRPRTSTSGSNALFPVT